MNILLISPKFVSDALDYYELPSGILYVATMLKSKGYNVRLLDMNEYCDQDVSDVLKKYYQQLVPDLVCVGGLSAFFDQIEMIIKLVRNMDKNTKILLGGGIVTSDKEFIAEVLNPDYIIFGEAEMTAVEFINNFENNLPMNTVDGMGYKEKDKWIFNKSRESIEDLDNLPFPDYSLLNMDNYFARQSPISTIHLFMTDFPKVLPISTSRSCPLTCTFCFHPIGQKYRKRSLDNVFEEIDRLVDKYQINTLLVQDEMMSASKSRLIEFSNRLKPYNLNWICSMLVTCIDEEIITTMKESGCVLISYGLESMSDKILTSMQKYGVTGKKIENALALTRKHKIGIQGNFIFGDIEETVETSNETLEWWKKNTVYGINLVTIEPYPGTHLYHHVLKNGSIKDKVKFVREGSRPFNFSKMSNPEYNNLISKNSMYKSQYRHYCDVISIEKDERVTSSERYMCKFRCPHCNEIVEYGNMFIRKANIFKLACRNCKMKFDVNANVFPNLEKLILKDKKKILELKEKKKPIIITPGSFENVFIEYFSLMDIDYTDLNIQYILDNNEGKSNSLFLDKYKIIKRDNQLLNEWQDSSIVIVSVRHQEVIKKELLDLGVNSDNIVSIDMQ